MKPVSHKTLRKPAFSFALFAVCVVLLSMEYMDKRRQSSNEPSAPTSCEVTMSADSVYTSDTLELPAYTTEDCIISHTGYTLCYNNEWRLPQWVAYELTAEETAGLVERKDHFYPDPQSPHPQVTTDDYRNSGYDRGHMAPAADMKWSETAMRESFYMTNICPQNHNLNAGDWKELEELTREWAILYGKVYVVCGPVVGENVQRIGTNQVCVPNAFFKAVLAFPNEQPQAIGFLFANTAGNRPLQNYVMNIDDLEVVIGMDLFHRLPDGVETAIELESQVNQWTW